MSATTLRRGWSADAVPPLVPDRDEAREWVEQELSDPAYDIAQPTPFDRVAQAISDFFGSLFDTQVEGPWGSWLALIAGIVVAGVIVAAFLIWGRPRTQSRGRARVGELFGDDESRSAAQLRRDAEAHAGRDEWDAAVILRFRALARGLTERGVVDAPPGTTVHGFAHAATRAFPASGRDLEVAAASFDDVRYLRRPGTVQLYRRIADTDDAVTGARPAIERESVG